MAQNSNTSVGRRDFLTAGTALAAGGFAASALNPSFSAAQTGGTMTDYARTIDGFGVYNEWGTLREVYVGRIDTAVVPDYDPVFDHAGKDVTDIIKNYGGLPMADALPENVTKSQQALDNLARAFENSGVTVHRVREFEPLETDYLANLQSGVWQTFPADQTWTIGRHFIECQLRYHMNAKQAFVLRERHLERVKAHPDARWVQIPASEPTKDPINAPGPYLEGGDILILGKEVLVGVDLDGYSTDMLGAEWLQRYLSDDGYNTTIVPIKDVIKIHLLAHLGVPREGLAIIYRPVLVDGIPDPMKDYEFIDITEEEAAWGGACIVPLDSKRCLLPSNMTRIADELAKRGIEPVLVDFEAAAFWGGAIRCATNIIRRDID